MNETDILNILPRVKHMNVVASSMGGWCRSSAAYFHDNHDYAQELLETGIKHYLEGIFHT